MDWDQMRVVLALHRTGSLRGAAETLGVNHATVARALNGAEASLGARLFDRSQQGLRITQSGELLLPHAHEMERHMLDIQRKISGTDAKPSGTVRVSMPPSFAEGLFIPIMAGFVQAYPEIEIEVIGTNAISDLSRLEADVSIRAAHKVPEEDIIGRRVIDYVVAAFATPAYLEAHPKLIETQGDGAHWIGFGAGQGWVKDTPLPRATSRHVLREVPMQLEAAAQGLGMAWVPAFMADGDPRLMRIPGLPTGPGRGVWVLLHGDLRRTARVRAFVDFFVGWLRAKKEMFAT